METRIAMFKGKRIRRIIHKDEWWFSVIDVCEVLTDSPDAGAYWRKLKQRLIEEGSEVVTFCHGLKLEAADGKRYETDCANTEGMFRVIQSIPSPKAEPFKRWLSKIGYERVKEIENPELAMERMRSIYEKKGYPKEWIDKRVRGIAVRHSLTKEWDDRGAQTLCLEEMLGVRIPAGAIFYGKTRRWMDVQFDDALRNETEEEVKVDYATSRGTIIHRKYATIFATNRYKNFIGGYNIFLNEKTSQHIICHNVGRLPFKRG